MHDSFLWDSQHTFLLSLLLKITQPTLAQDNKTFIPLI